MDCSAIVRAVLIHAVAICARYQLEIIRAHDQRAYTDRDAVYLYDSSRECFMYRGNRRASVLENTEIMFYLSIPLLICSVRFHVARYCTPRRTFNICSFLPTNQRSSFLALSVPAPALICFSPQFDF
jgi:hypothetical protein